MNPHYTQSSFFSQIFEITELQKNDDRNKGLRNEIKSLPIVPLSFILAKLFVELLWSCKGHILWQSIGFDLWDGLPDQWSLCWRMQSVWIRGRPHQHWWTTTVCNRGACLQVNEKYRYPTNFQFFFKIYSTAYFTNFCKFQTFLRTRFFCLTSWIIAVFRCLRRWK